MRPSPRACLRRLTAPAARCARGRRLQPIVGFRQDLLSNYLSILLLAFINAGLLEALIELTKDASKHLAVRATILLGELLYLVDKCGPSAESARAPC